MVVLKTNKNPASTITGYLVSMLVLVSVHVINRNSVNLCLGFGMNHLPIPSYVAHLSCGAQQAIKVRGDISTLLAPVEGSHKEKTRSMAGWHDKI